MDTDTQSSPLIVQCPGRAEQKGHPPLPRVHVAHVSLVTIPNAPRRACKDLTPYLSGLNLHPSAPIDTPLFEPTVIPLLLKDIVPEVTPRAVHHVPSAIESTGSEENEVASISTTKEFVIPTYPPDSGTLKALLIKKPSKLGELKEEEVLRWGQLTAEDLELSKVRLVSVDSNCPLIISKTLADGLVKKHLNLSDSWGTQPSANKANFIKDVRASCCYFFYRANNTSSFAMLTTASTSTLNIGLPSG
jgi:hypothetical protein